MMTPVPSSLFTFNFHVKLFTPRLKLIFSYNSNYRKTNHPHFIYDPRWVCSTVKSQAECVFDVNRILINRLFPKDEFSWARGTSIFLQGAEIFLSPYSQNISLSPPQTSTSPLKPHQQILKIQQGNYPRKVHQILNFNLSLQSLPSSTSNKVT